MKEFAENSIDMELQIISTTTKIFGDFSDTSGIDLVFLPNNIISTRYLYWVSNSPGLGY